MTHYSGEKTKNILIEIIEANDDLRDLQRNWDELGKIDAFGNILVVPSRKEKWSREEFFQHGEEEVSSVLQYIDSLQVNKPYRRALDFGCGAGRITQALCEYFEECYGVDIALSMIELANQYNRYKSKCRYFLNEREDLRLFEDNFFDFIYSNIVLQHMKPEYSRNYIKEFLRILTPGGLAIFQIPSERISAENNESQDNLKVSSELPLSAFKARITLINPPITMKTCEQMNLIVRLTNTGDVVWPASGDMDGNYWIRLGNHWIDQGRKTVINDDGRVSLPKDLNPNEEIELSLLITSPSRSGLYFLELDAVQEGVTWFKDKGSKAARVRVNIEKGDLPEKFCPRMEMHSVKKQEIIELINSQGGRIIDVQEYNVCGKGWLSFRYCVTKL